MFTLYSIIYKRISIFLTTLQTTRITAFLIRISISILHHIYSIIWKTVNIILKTLRTTEITAFIICNTILILHNVFPYCAISYLCCASEYSFFYSIYALNNANNWIQITFWVPNLHITLLLIQSNVTFFSQCSAVFFWKSVDRSRWPHVE